MSSGKSSSHGRTLRPGRMWPGRPSGYVRGSRASFGPGRGSSTGRGTADASRARGWRANSGAASRIASAGAETFAAQPVVVGHGVGVQVAEPFLASGHGGRGGGLVPGHVAVGVGQGSAPGLRGLDEAGVAQPGGVERGRPAGAVGLAFGADLRVERAAGAVVLLGGDPGLGAAMVGVHLDGRSSRTSPTWTARYTASWIASRNGSGWLLPISISPPKRSRQAVTRQGWRPGRAAGKSCPPGPLRSARRPGARRTRWRRAGQGIPRPSRAAARQARLGRSPERVGHASDARPGCRPRSSAARSPGRWSSRLRWKNMPARRTAVSLRPGRRSSAARREPNRLTACSATTHVPVDEVVDHLLAIRRGADPHWRSRCRQDAAAGGDGADAGPARPPSRAVAARVSSRTSSVVSWWCGLAGSAANLRTAAWR